MEHSNCSNAVGSLALSVDGTIVIQDPSGHLRLRSLARPNEPDRILSVGSDRILALAISPNGRLVAIAPYGRAELWDMVAGTRLAVLATGLTAHSSSRLLAFSPDGGKVAVAAGGRDVLVWDVAAEQGRAIRVPDASFLDAVAFSPDGRTLAVNARSPGAACLLDVTEQRYTPVPGASKATDLAFSPDGRLLAVASPFGSLHLHDATDGRPLASLLWHTGSATSVAFSPDSRWVATASDDGFIKLWPVEALLSSGPGLRAQ
jgi:WD40 repeat protein